MSDMASLATVASIISGFGIAALVFRIQRELKMQCKGGRAWVPWADRLLIGAVLISLLFVVLPLLLFPGWPAVSRLSTSMCAASAVLTSGYIPSVLAHYGLLFGRERSKPAVNPEPDERRWVYATILSAIAATLVVLLKNCQLN